jgi:hypothetical protein
MNNKRKMKKKKGKQNKEVISFSYSKGFRGKDSGSPL